MRPEQGAAPGGVDGPSVINANGAGSVGVLVLAGCVLAALAEPAALRPGLVIDELTLGATGLADPRGALRAGGREHPVMHTFLRLFFSHRLLQPCMVRRPSCLGWRETSRAGERFRGQSRTDGNSPPPAADEPPAGGPSGAEVKDPGLRVTPNIVRCSWATILVPAGARSSEAASPTVDKRDPTTPRSRRRGGGFRWWNRAVRW